jgi:hypothetical protein
VVDNGGVDELAAAISERHQATAPVGGVRLALHETHLLQPVETVRHRARREDHRVEEPSWVHAVRRAGSVQGNQHQVLAEGDPVPRKHPAEAHALQQRQPRDPLQGMGWRHVEVGSLAVPLFDDPIDLIHDQEYTSTSRLLTWCLRAKYLHIETTSERDGSSKSAVAAVAEEN